MWRPASSACFYSVIFCFFVFLCVPFDNQSFFFAVHILSIWISPCIGLSSLDISMLCLSSLPQTVLSDAQGAQRNLLFLLPFGKDCQIKETSGLSALTCITSLPVRVPVVSHAFVLCSVDGMICFVFNNSLNWHPDESWLTPPTSWLSSLFCSPETLHLSPPRMMTFEPFAS